VNTFVQNLIYKGECFKIIGACMEVHKELGPGFLEAVYQEALAMEFSRQNIPFVQKKGLDIEYKKILLNKKYEADFFCYDKIIVEIKALNKLISDHEGQILNYMKASNCKLGILVNFGERSLKYKRMVH